MTRQSESSPWCSWKDKRGCISLKKDEKRAQCANKGGEGKRVGPKEWTERKKERKERWGGEKVERDGDGEAESEGVEA